MAAAVDQAVADGVDVINYSLYSGAFTEFLFAAGAGVFVSAGAGNCCSLGQSDIANGEPWVMTVAAGSHDRRYEGTVKLGNSQSFVGESLAPDVGPQVAIYAEDAKKASADPMQARLCFLGTLDPAKVTGKIVVCERGENERIEKSLEVKQARGVGMILLNSPAFPELSNLVAEIHSVPTVHLDVSAYFPILNYIKSPNPSAFLSSRTLFGLPAPTVAQFSMHGPAPLWPDLLKPDIMAPGVNILAAVAPPGYGDRNFEFLSGTSMSTPHVAGLAALLKQKFPSWTPAAIKSALMTTASTRDNRGIPIPGDPLAFGSGQVTPNKATDPGLVYDSTTPEYIAYLCGIKDKNFFATSEQIANWCAGVPKVSPFDVNYPSISVGSLVGAETVKRRVTNVGPASTYIATITPPPGIAASVVPSTLTLQPGATANYELKLTRMSAPFNDFGFGEVVWSNGLHSVRSPMGVRPLVLDVPLQVAGTGGTITYPVKFGFGGPFGATARGLVPATTIQSSVPDDPEFRDFSELFYESLRNGRLGTRKFEVYVPPGTTYARFALFDEFTDGNDDLDLYVFRGSGGPEVEGLVGASTSVTSLEAIELTNPIPGTYYVVVHGFETDGPDAIFTLFHWIVGSNSSVNTSLAAPAQATPGATGTVSINFTGLQPATKYVGSIAYSGEATAHPPTMVFVDVP